MSNNWFKFKQFTVYQDLAAMKVGTDAVLVGAWTQANKPLRILDIGCGTGVIALMAAQKWESAHIDAIDSDDNAYEQSKKNFELSQWDQRLHAHHIKLQDFVAQHYDLIISNPPYFINSLKNPNPSKSAARHTDSLPHCELLAHAARLLSDNGKFTLILPTDTKNNLLEEAEKHCLAVHRITDVANKINQKPIRILVEFQKIYCREPLYDTLIIRDISSNDYTSQYKKLTQDFYLKF